MQEIEEVEALNFDRYEKQLSKLAKGGELNKFAIATCEKEMFVLQETQSISMEYLKEQENVKYVLSQSMKRD